MALGDSIEVDSGAYTPESLKARRRLAETMLGQGMQTGPVGHWSQGLNRIVQAMMGGYQLGELERKEKLQQTAGNEALLGLLGPAPAAAQPASLAAPAPVSSSGGAGPSASADGSYDAGNGVKFGGPPIDAQTGQPYRNPGNGDTSPYGPAIASIESGGEKDPYRAIGPATRTGDRAYGKYQVMGANIPSWTKEVLGQQMTPEQFLASDDAQEKVFATKFGASLQKYGNPQDAASVWFTGKPLAEGANRRASDPSGHAYGPTGAGYVDQFTQALGQNADARPAAAPARIADASGAIPSAAPAAAMPQVDPATRAQVGRLLANPATRELGMAMVQKLITSETKTTDDTQEWKLARSQGYQGTFRDWQLEMKQAGRAQTNVNLSGDQSFAKNLNENLAKDLTTRRTGAQGAVQTITSMNDARAMLDSDAGVITGAGAEWKLGFGKMLQAAGVDLAENGDAIANTEAFGSQMANQVLNQIKTLGANPSNADREFIEKAAGGKITLNEQSIRKILDIGDKSARNTIKSYNADASQIDPKTAPYRLLVDEPEAYKRKARAADEQPHLVRTEMPAAGTLAPGATLGADALKTLPDGAVIKDTSGKRYRVQGGQPVPIE